MKTVRLKVFTKSGTKLIWSGFYRTERGAEDALRNLKRCRFVPKDARGEIKDTRKSS